MCSESLYNLETNNEYLEFVPLSKENTSCVGKLAEDLSTLSFFDYYPNASRTELTTLTY